jgi:hypothetical protein
MPSAREADWQAEAEAAMTKFARPLGEGEGGKALQLSEQFLVLITCRDEKEQAELLGRFQAEGLECNPRPNALAASLLTISPWYQRIDDR